MFIATTYAEYQTQLQRYSTATLVAISNNQVMHRYLEAVDSGQHRPPSKKYLLILRRVMVVRF